MKQLFVVAILSILFFIHSTNGYHFDCVDECDCDTDDSAIHCHNKPNREQLQLPSKPLRGYSVLGITNNNLKTLPSEEELLTAFPDLKAVDVECNLNFDCSTLKQFSKLQIMSDCDNTNNETHCESFPNNYPPTEDCDNMCQAKRYYEKLHQYILKLWRALLKKLNKMRANNPWIQDIEKWVQNATQSVKEAARDATKEDGWATDAGNWFTNASRKVVGFFKDIFD